jgi:hypothetical protein
MDDREQQSVHRARDEASKTIRGVVNESNSSTQIFKSNCKEAGFLAGAVLGDFGPMTRAAVEHAASYEQNRIAFESMPSSAGRSSLPSPAHSAARWSWSWLPSSPCSVRPSPPRRPEPQQGRWSRSGAFG